MGIERLIQTARKMERNVVGLNSGTSMDGIDALCVRIQGSGTGLRFEPLAFLVDPYPAGIRERLLAAPDLPLEEAARLHVHLGELFAAAARKAAAKAGLAMEEVDLVGSHGQTVCHLPPAGPGRGAATLQIADIDVIAERTGTVVIGDFRARDVAAGGAGAPLMPYLDWVLFHGRPRTVTLNLGGIAAVTAVDADLESCVAFDVGPCSMLLDLLASRLTHGRESYDPGGRLAAEGTVDPVLLDRLLSHPFYAQAPPRTTGREAFGSRFADDLLQRNTHLRLQDILATACELVARSIAGAIDEHLTLKGGPREIVASGGGVANLTLMRRLKGLLAPVPVSTLQSYGIDPDAKEALLFATLAHEGLSGCATNVPRATGARWPVALGKISL